MKRTHFDLEGCILGIQFTVYSSYKLNRFQVFYIDKYGKFPNIREYNERRKSI